ncbi:unnamed protein product [Prorocentrum cordatum]|uniref:Uncharacterized protein n=1 Tax=Prorocentrum cordatum TaxID=2364126 RepID=A0ABN9VZZ3_9DINO|nr:unnamed protein product [Polarella glacialis]
MDGLQEIVRNASVDPTWVKLREEIKDSDGIPMELIAEQKHGRFMCDRCGKDHLRSTDGTWISDDARLMVAQNRPQAYLDGTNMGWHCEICCIRHLEEEGIPAPTGATVADKVKEYEHWRWRK